jgi:hypothetical protein
MTLLETSRWDSKHWLPPTVRSVRLCHRICEQFNVVADYVDGSSVWGEEDWAEEERKKEVVRHR